MKTKNRSLLWGIIGGAVILFTVTLFAYCAVMSAKGYSVSSGRLYFSENGVYLIDGDDKAMRISDCSDDKELFKGYRNGDGVVLLHGILLTTYPAQTDGYRVIRISKGDGKYKPENEVIGVRDIANDDSFRTTICFENGKSYTFMGGESVELTDLLNNLEYDSEKLCKCLPEHKIYTEFGTEYGIRLAGGSYARCDKGQAELTEEQIVIATRIIEWAKQKAD